MNAAAQTLTTETAPASRFTENGDGTVTDTGTGLTWSKATLCDGEIDQHEAARICGALDLGGHSDWRLPTIDELLTLVDRSRYSPAIDTMAFPDTKNDWYWSSTEAAWASSSAWFVDFDVGDSNGFHRGYDGGFVRAVRSLPAGQ